MEEEEEDGGMEQQKTGGRALGIRRKRKEKIK